MLTMIRHNIGLCVGVVLAVCLVFWTYGCESKVQSPVTGKPVTYGELSIEIQAEATRLETELDTLQKKAALSFQELVRKDEIKQKLFEFASLTATNNAFNPTGLITLVGSLLGVGAIVDNRIKDVVIANRPLPTTTTT
jgi:hypothetical protein